VNILLTGHIIFIGLTLIIFKKRIVNMEFVGKVQVSGYDENLVNDFENSNKIIDNKYEKLLDSIDIGYVYFKIIKDQFGNPLNTKVLEINQALVNILGEKKEEILSYTFKTFMERYVGEEYEYSKVMEKLQEEGQYRIDDYINIRGDKWIKFSICRMKKENFAIIIIDVSERKKYLDEMNYLANYDVLTDTKNRYSLYNHMADLKKKNKKFAVFFLDLDNFKLLNDNLGHTLGDEVLHKVASILRTHENDVINIGRLGGDEFLIILEDNISTENIKTVGQGVLNSLNSNVLKNTYSYNVSASLGVSVFNKDTDNIGTLLKYADIAMYYSKKNGGNKVSIFKGEMLENEIKRMC
jgi:diguanylate cyclase (GGDEF)-like protein